MGRGRVPSDASGIITKNTGLGSQFTSTNDGNDDQGPGQAILKLAHPGVLSLRRAIQMAGGVTFKGACDASQSTATAAGISGTINKGDYFIVTTGSSSGLSLTSAIDNSPAITVWDKGDWVVAEGTGKYFRVRNFDSSITTSGTNVQVVGSFTESSSRDIKDNIEVIGPQLHNVEKINAVKFEYKDSGDESFGFIAEELDEVFPELVKKDENNKPVAVSYSKMTAVLLESIKELSNKIKEQEEKLKNLGGER